MTDVDALTAFVIDKPDDPTGWCAYSDHCRELGHEEWADLAIQFRDAHADGRAGLIAQHWQCWPPATALAVRSMSGAMERMVETGRQLAGAFAAAGTRLGQIMAPTIEALDRIGRRFTSGPTAEPGTNTPR